MIPHIRFLVLLSYIFYYRTTTQITGQFILYSSLVYTEIICCSSSSIYFLRLPVIRKTTCYFILLEHYYPERDRKSGVIIMVSSGICMTSRKHSSSYGFKEILFSISKDFQGAQLMVFSVSNNVTRHTGVRTRND